MDVFFLLLALLGHAFLWIGVVNRLHAVGFRRRTIHAITYVFFLCAAVIPIGVGWYWFRRPMPLANTPWKLAAERTPAGLLVSAYLVACWLVAPVTLLRFVWFAVFRRPSPLLRSQRRRRVEIDLVSAAASPAELAHHPLVHLPLNEMLQLEVVQRVLDVPRMPAALDGLSIVHLADLHLTGRVGKAYFREVVRRSNELRPDLVCITGDLVDRPACMDWLADTLGQLVARHGVYYVLGNHDCSVDLGRLRRTLDQSGLINLGGRWIMIEIGGTPVVLAGNERPWIDAAADLRTCPPAAPAGPLRIALAHTPDQFAWARAEEVDLLLVGHTHGGQIRLPPLGAIFTPSTKGVKYISGIYFAAPPRFCTSPAASPAMCPCVGTAGRKSPTSTFAPKTGRLATSSPLKKSSVGVAVVLPPLKIPRNRGWQCNCHPNYFLPGDFFNGLLGLVGKAQRHPGQRRNSPNVAEILRCAENDAAPTRLMPLGLLRQRLATVSPAIFQRRGALPPAEGSAQVVGANEARRGGHFLQRKVGADEQPFGASRRQRTISS